MATTKTMKIDWLGDQRYVGRSDGGQQILIDNSANKIGVSPMDAVLAALGTCTAYDVVGIMAKRRTPLSHYRMEVVGERADETPARYTRITVRHIAGGEGVTQEQLEKAAHLSHEKYCSVAASLNAEIVLEVVAEDAEARA
ncbi:OsmC family protein [Deinococcus radiophilus]|uniref:OsmC family peroxiredoxin n=1 Tax=Deinococcus radiophilus TaxID=32062 RepID=A0A3S0K511_9DEIO|nr:OsmC family protein [Deinococcus radiophilus]RTR20934.1 OsmC family peroxiredoxin [Deinococcus radiophilus]UFA50875.1 OsmC family protein [Deinococcus radiophilus]